MKKIIPMAEIVRMEDDLQSILENLRKIRQGMTDDGMETVELQVGKAEFYLNWMKEWAIRSEAAFRVQKAKAHAARTKEKLRKKRPI